MDKKALRAEIKAKKRAMTEEQIAATSEALARQLYDHPAYKEATSIFGYLSYNQEVRTMPMLEQDPLLFICHNDHCNSCHWSRLLYTDQQIDMDKYKENYCTDPTCEICVI